MAKSLLHSVDAFGKLWNGRDWSLYYTCAPFELGHEHYSVRCACQIFDDLINDDPSKWIGVEPIDVLGIMEGTDNCEPSDNFVASTQGILSMLLSNEDAKPKITEIEAAEIFQHFFKTLISGELDVDKMDYLLRDSFHSGCKYGIYNLDHLLSTIRLGVLNDPSWLGLAIAEKGVSALEDFVYSRFQLYQHLYSHRVVGGFKWLLTRALDDLHDIDDQLTEIDKIIFDIDKFKDFTDGYFWERFRSHASNNSSSAADKLLKREKLQWLCCEKNASEITKKATTQRIHAELKLKCVDFKSSIRFSRLDDGSYSDIQVLVPDPFNNGKRSLCQLTRITNFFEKFDDIEIVHFYKNPFKN